MRKIKTIKNELAIARNRVRLEVQPHVSKRARRDSPALEMRLVEAYESDTEVKRLSQELAEAKEILAQEQDKRALDKEYYDL